jgi:hypothetical protein
MDGACVSYVFYLAASVVSLKVVQSALDRFVDHKLAKARTQTGKQAGR